MPFMLGCAAHPNGMGIFKVFSIIHRFLADCLACHHISLALKKQSGAGGGEEGKISCTYSLAAPGIKKEGFGCKRPRVFFSCYCIF